MHIVFSRNARTWVLAVFFAAGFAMGAHGQRGPLEQGESWLEGLRHFLEGIGERVTEFVPVPAPPEDDVAINIQNGQVRASRTLVHEWESGPGASVLVNNDLSASRIGVSTWDEQFVQVVAAIAVYADDESRARNTLEQVQLQVAPVEEEERRHLTVRTHRPEAPQWDNVSVVVDYTVYVPRDADVYCDNIWGDTYVEGVGGRLMVRARHGEVNLFDIHGPAYVWATGQGPLEARDLRGGGSFILRNVQARFTNVSRSLRVDNLRGSVELRGLAPGADVEVSNDGGTIALYVPEGQLPNIEATAYYSDILTDLPLTVVNRPPAQHLQVAGASEAARVHLETMFQAISITREGSPPLIASRNPRSGMVELVENHTHPAVPEGTRIQVDTVYGSFPGDVTVRGVDEDTLTVVTHQQLRPATGMDAADVGEWVEVRIEENGGTLLVQPVYRTEEAAESLLDVRVDLEIMCPRTSPILIHAAQGTTTVTGVQPVEVEQVEGRIHVSHIKGQANLVNRKGGITVAECDGPVRAIARDGDVNVSRIHQRLHVEFERGKAVIEDPLGELFVRGKDGNAAVLATEPVGGNHNVVVERGNISMLFAPEAEGVLRMTAQRGRVENENPAYVLEGSMQPDRQSFTTSLSSSGNHTLWFETVDGNIILR